MEEYVWESGGGQDRVVKEHDHAMDDMRYFVSTVLAEPMQALAVFAVERECDGGKCLG